MTNIPVELPPFGWGLLAVVVLLGLIAVISTRRMKPIIRAMFKVALWALFITPWIAIPYAFFLGIPFSHIDLSIHFLSVTIPSAFVKFAWLSFDILIIVYGLPVLVKFIRDRRTSR